MPCAGAVVPRSRSTTTTSRSVATRIDIDHVDRLTPPPPGFSRVSMPAELVFEHLPMVVWRIEIDG
jgi:hypothetical protein